MLYFTCLRFLIISFYQFSDLFVVVFLPDNIFMVYVAAVCVRSVLDKINVNLYVEFLHLIIFFKCDGRFVRVLKMELNVLRFFKASFQPIIAMFVPFFLVSMPVF